MGRSDLTKAVRLVRQLVKETGAQGMTQDDTLAKVSIVGGGMTNAPGYAAAMFKALAEEQVNIELVTTSDIRITCLISRAQVKEAVRALHRAFALEK